MGCPWNLRSRAGERGKQSGKLFAARFRLGGAKLGHSLLLTLRHLYPKHTPTTPSEQVEGSDAVRPLPHKDVIYSIEDVDAAAHVVLKRGGGAQVDPIVAALQASQKASAPGAAANNTSGGEADAAAAFDSLWDKPAVLGPQLPGPMLMGRSGRGVGFMDGGSDALNLAGLLNVLDGVVDTPGRLLVLSTNHPEVLDPALIRPGRINK